MNHLQAKIVTSNFKARMTIVNVISLAKINFYEIQRRRVRLGSLDMDKSSYIHVLAKQDLHYIE